MEAGLSFDASLVKISERMEGPLIDELITVFKQIQLGRNRNEALKSLADSCEVEELKTFISAVIQQISLVFLLLTFFRLNPNSLELISVRKSRLFAAKVPTK